MNKPKRNNKQKQDEVRNPFPRIHEVAGNANPKLYQFKLRTDYDQRLWPPPKVEKHGTG